jgi:tRNA1Val (adenine37-N6)-methyltransferase
LFIFAAINKEFCESMANDYFQFRQFIIRQSLCAMKVGTDGTLLGAWAHGGNRILDIGTGTGLIALMMAQRFPQAAVTGVDIDEMACRQAQENVCESPFSNIGIVMGDITHYSSLISHHSFDAIVSNPPFFNHSLECPDERRTQARHTSTLTYRQLMTVAAQLISDEGELSVVIPAEYREQLETEAFLNGFLLRRRCAVRTTPKKSPRRYLLAFGKHPADLEEAEGVIEERPGVRSVWYQELTKDFYL